MTRASDPRSRVSGNAQARFCRRGSRGDFSPLATYRYDYANPKEARQGLTRYLDFYNHRRPHQALGYQTPAEVYVAPVTTPHTNDDPLSPASRREKGEVSTLKCPSPVS